MFYGADTEAVSAFATRCGSGARTLDELVQGLSAAVMAASWQGPDADSLRDTWSGRTAPELQRAAALLRHRGDELNAHADEQEETSAVETVGAAGPLWGQPLRAAPALPGLGPLASRFGDLIGHLSTPTASSPFGPGLSAPFQGMELSQGISGIAPGGDDPRDDVDKAVDWILGRDGEEETSPVPGPPDHPEEKEEPQRTGDPVDLDDWGLGDLGEKDETPNPLDGPTKPEGWPEDMPWPPPAQGPVDDNGQYVYGSEGYGDAGDATTDDRPVGTQVDEGDGGRVGDDVHAEGEWTVNGGYNVSEDDYGNHTYSHGWRIGVDGEVGGGTDDGPGATLGGTAEAYAEVGGTVGPDGVGVGMRAGAEASGSASYTEVNEDGSTTNYTVEANAEAGGHANAYGQAVRNEDGEISGAATGFDIGGGYSAGYSYTEENISPNGWFKSSHTTSQGVGKSAGAGGDFVVSTDEIGFSAGWSIPKAESGPLSTIDTGPLSGVSLSINPNRIVEDVSGGRFDADDVVDTVSESAAFVPAPLPLWPRPQSGG